MPSMTENPGNAEVAKAALREHELNKYLQLFLQTRSDENPGFFSIVQPPNFLTLHDTLSSQAELLAFRLGVQGAFVLLFDGERPYFLAGSHISDIDENEVTSPCGRISWLGCDDRDSKQWLKILNDTTGHATSCSEDPVLTISSMRRDNRSAKISSVCGSPHLSFFAGTPLLSRSGVAIGAVFIVDKARESLTAHEKRLLVTTAGQCMDQLKTAREIEHQERWQRVNKQLSKFVKSPAIRNQGLEEPPSLARTDQQRRRQDKVEDVKNLALRNKKDPSSIEGLELPETTYTQGPENERLLEEEMDRDERLIEKDDEEDAKTETAHVDDEKKRSPGSGETTYRKIFRRAAECLRDALKVDGVLFSDGLVGHHGAIHAAPELEDELQRDISQRPKAADYPEDTAGTDQSEPTNGRLPEDTPKETKVENGDGANTRKFSSPEWIRGISVKRPAQILGMTTSDDRLIPESSRISQSSMGLARIDECHLQLLMDKYPAGVVWYVDGETQTCYKVVGDTLTEEALEDTKRLLSSFRGVRQVLFQPLTDPVSLKRLAGCFAWTTQVFPLLSDTTDVPSLWGFLHVLESEISRIDASAAVKQKEAFVSSVSHELRTPLHGILGSSQLLADTRLNSFQASLVETIKTSGSTLNETLTSVLSYAKINQFERQQHKFRERQPPDERPSWSLESKGHQHPGPDTEYQDLYVCTNVAMLFEEIAGVLEGGRSYDKSMSPRGVTVTLEMDYRENWNFLTEPGALRRIAVNIIGNALKYTTQGSVIISLTSSKLGPNTGNIPVAPQNENRRLVTFSVKDTGKGMSKDFMDNHLFVPFTQEDTTSSSGVGLGMSIVRSLLSLLSGHITVNSEQGKGTEITVTMPMTSCTQDDEEKPAVDMERCMTRVRGETLSAILFGFPKEVRKSLERYLAEWFHVKILDHEEDAEPDLVLMDEGNEDCAEEVARTAGQYGQTGILLSIAMETDRLAQPMTPIKGYQFCERIPPPIGPHNLGKSLSACVDRLNELHKRRQEGWGDDSEPVLETHQPFRGPEGRPARNVSKENGDEGEEERGQTYSTEKDGTANGFRNPSRENKKENFDRGRQRSGQPNGRSLSRPPSAGSDASIPSVDLSSLRVLVAEDNAINRKILGAFLKKTGIQNVQYAENGEIAVRAVEKEQPGQFDIIFMDLSMPVMDGFTATREIRRIERESDIKKTTYVVALTGLASDRDEDEARRAGVDMFVTKPVQFDKLTDVLKQQESKILGRT